MKNFLINIASRFQQTEKKLGFTEQLVDKTWLKIDQGKNVVRQLEFQRTQVLIESTNGVVNRKA